METIPTLKVEEECEEECTVKCSVKVEEECSAYCEDIFSVDKQHEMTGMRVDTQIEGKYK